MADTKEQPKIHCDICGTEIPEGQPACATTGGTIIDGVFSMDHESWATVMCPICSDQLDEVAAELDRARECLEMRGN